MNTTPKVNDYLNLDGFIKFILAVALAILPFYLTEQINFVFLSLYLFAVTVLLRIKFKALILSAASYVIIVLIPYFFGLLLNFLIFNLSSNPLFAYNQDYYAVFLRLFRLLIIWYVSILYFHTTPIKTIIGLLDKFLFPLKLIGAPVKDYLKVIMCIVEQLKETGTEITRSLGESMKAAVGGKKGLFRLNIKEISHIIVSLLVKSFEKIDKVQSYVESVRAEDLYEYRFSISLKDVLAILSIVFLITVVMMIEHGYLLY